MANMFLRYGRQKKKLNISIDISVQNHGAHQGECLAHQNLYEVIFNDQVQPKFLNVVATLKISLNDVH